MSEQFACQMRAQHARTAGNLHSLGSPTGNDAWMQLESFRNGSRYNALMTPVAQSLSREDIDDLAAYFSSIGPLASAR